MKSNFGKHLKESSLVILPITILAILLTIIFVTNSFSLIIQAIVASILLIFGITLFKIGVDKAFIPIGGLIGEIIERKHKIWFIIIIGFIFGLVSTLAEPGAHVLVGLVQGISFWPLLISLAIGIGIFLAIAFIREVFHLSFKYIILGGYAIIFLLMIFVPAEFLPIAFDLGGATTGEMTIPFIMTLGVGIAAASKNSSKDDNFGLIAICSIGPIIAAMLLSIIIQNSNNDVNLGIITEAAPLSKTLNLFLSAIINYAIRIMISILPIIVIFMLFQIFKLKLSFQKLKAILKGFIFLYVGVTIFLVGVSVSFLPMGQIIGYHIASSSISLILIIIGVILGAIVILAEPAIYVFIKEVLEVTKGKVSKKALIICLCVSIGAAIAVAMTRVLFGINFLWIILPVYGLAIILSFIVPKLYVSIAFDAGGVASGPLMAGFMLPFSMGASYAMGGNVYMDAFGLIALVAIFPVLAIQILGLIMKIRIILKLRNRKLIKKNL
ncbi:MAG: DUF1538 domain-containing protein [Erysipelotrichales bacterium]|nr:DUF1538 domain-containing protein [Erysipelotrichales bacterium]